MAKRKSKKRTTTARPTDITENLRKSLTKHKKAELIAVLIELAKDDRGILRRLTARFDVAASPEELADATRHAIADATAFDKRYINYNFSYDYAAYSEVKRNLTRLIDMNELQTAMALSLELLSAGSYQVEMSDEGLMTEEIEECLTVVLDAVKTSNLPTNEVVTWCETMLKTDRVGFICERPLRDLHNSLRTSQS
jgi:hypothetical protein